MLLVLALFSLFLMVLFAGGLSLLHWAGFRARYAADIFLAAFVSGISLFGLSVFLLLLLNAYFAPAAFALAIAPLAYLAWQQRQGKLSELLPSELDPAAGLPANALDRAAALICFSILLVGLADSLTSPMTLWDSIVSWDKWATEWAQRTNMYDRLLGYYPQLLPMAGSLLYKVTGTAGDVIPVTQYALHGFHPAVGAVLLIAILRLAALMEVVAWPTLILVFGSATLRLHLTAGATDLLAAAVFTAAAAMYFAILREQVSAARGFASILLLAFFGVFFAKTNNLTFLLIPAVTSALIRYGRSVWTFVPKGLGTAIQLSVILFTAFLLHQYVNIGTPPEQMRLNELNFDPRIISEILAKTTANSLQGTSMTERLYLAAARVIEVYEFPAALTKPVMSLSVIALLLSALSRSFWPLLITGCVQFGIWSQLAAYDTRNLFAAIPLLGFCLTRGVNELQHRLRTFRPAVWALSILIVPFCAWSAGRISADVFRMGSAVIEQSKSRIAALNGGPAGRIALFFPKEFPAYQFLTSLRPFREADHVMAGSRMYRFLPNGGYPLSFWSAANLVPGDGYVTIPPNGLPHPDRWTSVYDDGDQRLYLLDKEPKVLRASNLLLTGGTPPRLSQDSGSGPWSVESTGEAGYVVYNLPVRSLKDGDSITWRVVVSATADDVASVASAYVTYDQSIVDPRRTRVLADITRVGENLVAYSGILTFSGKPVSDRTALDGILVGIAIRKPGRQIKINEFRISLYR